MSTKSQLASTFKFFSVLILIFGVLFSTFNGGYAPSVHAQAVATTPKLEEEFPNNIQAAVALGEPGLSYRYLKTFGKTRVGYLADAAHLDYPYGLGSDGNNVWIAELWGHRALKYDNTGKFKKQIGTSGVFDLGNTTLAEIADVAVDAAGNTWVVDDGASHIAKFDSSGNFLSELGVLYQSGNDNDHFASPISVAFDASGNIYVSDGAQWWSQDIGNHRIQIFDHTGAYLTTIGETEVAASDNSHFHGPRHIATYQDQLFVADAGNHRIQIFNIASPASPTYVATLGVSGETGGDNAHLGNPSGVAADANYIYVADTWNSRVQVFNRITRVYVATIGTGWGTGNYQFKLPADVSVDSAGNLYVADFVNTRVQQFSHSGSTWTYMRKYGATNVPYLTDGYHYNQPSGVAVAGDGSIYITEDGGHRLLKLNAAGIPVWTVGAAGVKGDWDDSDNRLDNPADVALDAAGRVYVADRWHGRIQIYNPDGSFFNKISDLACPAGVTVAPDGRVFVADPCNSTVSIYTSSLIFTATLGVMGESGSDNLHFNGPEDVAVDGNGNIFVSDQVNQRIQVFNASQVYVRTMGIPGECGDGFDHFCNPNGLFVDGNNRLYVADQDNNRIQVFDADGAYLTTIAGSWGTNNGQLIAPTGVAVDGAGNVYVTDYIQNHRVQKFAPGVPNWQQVNLNGFGNRYNRGITASEVFNGMIYAGASNWDEGGSIWRSADAHTWEQVTQPGFGNAYASTNPAIIDMVDFNGQLYASAGWDDSTGQLWRSPNGTTWNQVVGDGFGDADNNSIDAMAVYNNMLYVGTGNSITGPQIWRSNSGDSSSWNNVVTTGLGCGDCRNVTSLMVFKNALYAAVEAHTDPPAGMQIWRTINGSDWSQVGSTGFGDAQNYQTGGFAVFNGNLYIGTRNDVTGGQIWSSSDGSAWTRIVGNGFGGSKNYKVEALFPFGGNLYAGMNNDITGIEIWRSANGTAWSQISLDGFGDSNNNGTLWSSAQTIFNNNLYVGTWNWGGNGGEIWKFLQPVVTNINTLEDTGDSTLSEGELVIVPVTKLAITFNKDIKPPTSAQFALKKGITAITINSANYDSLTKTVTLVLNGGKKLPFGKYTLTIKKNITDLDNHTMGVNFVRHFNLVKPPSVPALASPANNALLYNLQPKLDWGNSTVPAGTAFDHYQIQLATDPAFTSPLDQNTAISEFTPATPLTSDTKYYWRVRAFNTLGQFSAWSAARYFREAILFPILVLPGDGSAAGTRMPTFVWSDVVNNSGYIIQISASPTFGTLLINTNTSLDVSTFTPSTNLPAGKTLYWRVRTKGLNGPSAWSNGFSFTTP